MSDVTRDRLIAIFSDPGWWHDTYGIAVHVRRRLDTDDVTFFVRDGREPEPFLRISIKEWLEDPETLSARFTELREAVLSQLARYAPERTVKYPGVRFRPGRRRADVQLHEHGVFAYAARIHLQDQGLL